MHRIAREQLINIGPRIEAAASISMRSSMLRKATVVLAIVLLLGSSGLSTSAFARSGGHSGGGRGGSFCGNHPCGGFGGICGGSFCGFGKPPYGSHKRLWGGGQPRWVGPRGGPHRAPISSLLN